MNTIILDILVACALVGAGAGVMYHHEHPKIAAAEARAESAEKAFKVNGATSAHLASKTAQNRAHSASAAASLHAAVAGPAASWAEQPVPPEVLDALSK